MQHRRLSPGWEDLMAKPVRNSNFKSGAVAQLYGLLSKSGRPPNLLIPQPRVKEVESY